MSNCECDACLDRDGDKVAKFFHVFREEVEREPGQVFAEAWTEYLHVRRIAAAAREYVRRARELEAEVDCDCEPEGCAPEWRALLAAVEGK